MALDQAIAEHVQAGQSPATLRFYGWHPRVLSLGYAQPLASVDRPLARELRVDLVRRPTGGQAILHNDELTYAVALPHHHRLAERGVLRSYAAISRGLTAGLERVGLDPELGDWEPNADQTGDGLCFGSASRHEISVHGHKLIGSAQTRVHRGLLQHGSVVLSHDPDISRLLGLPALDPRPLGLRDLLPDPPTVGTLIQAFAEGFASELDAGLAPSQWSPDELTRAEELIRLRYASDAWLTRC
jgi:lipoate-protein ligase A